MSETSIVALVGHLPASANTVPVLNPANGKKIYDLPQLSTQQVTAAVRDARNYQPEWVNTSIASRVAVIKKLHHALLENESKLLDLLQLETGKSRAHAFEEVAGSIGAVNYFAATATKTLARKKTRSGIPVLTKTFVDHVPVGVVGVVTPWNYPLALAMFDVIPALVAGNSVVQKTDNQSTLISLFARHLAIEAGLPERAWTIVVGDGEVVGNTLTDNVDYVAFTGSTATGRKVAARAAARLIGCSLELGGKNPMIILPGANLKKAAEIAIAGAFGSAGQLCVSIERVFVADQDKEAFLAEVAKRTESLIVGKTSDFTTDIGTLTGYNQFQRVMGFVQDAVDTGANVVAGARPLPELGPYFYAPTVLTNVNPKARLYAQEVFGPVIDVEGYDVIDQAIALANDTDYGLNASVVGDVKQAIEVAGKLNAGSVNINEGYRASFASMESPMGGTKASGQGRRNGPAGILRFTEAKSIGVAAGVMKLPTRGRHYQRMAPLMRFILKRFK